MSALLDKYIGPLARRVRGMIAQAVVTLTDDSSGLQRLQLRVLASEAAEVLRFQQYGLTSRPLAGAQAILLAVGSNRSQLVAVAVDDARYRPRDLAPGEVAIYTDEGDRIVIKRGGRIEISASSAVVINAPVAQITGNLTVGGDAIIGGISFAAHVHGGVTPGGSSTGVPA